MPKMTFILKDGSRKEVDAPLGEPGTAKVEIDDLEVAGEEFDGPPVQRHVPVQRQVIHVVRPQHHDGWTVSQRMERDTDIAGGRRVSDRRQRHDADYRTPTADTRLPGIEDEADGVPVDHSPGPVLARLIADVG